MRHRSARSGETLRDEALRDEALRDEALRDEALRDEALRDEALRDEALRDEALRDEALRDEALRDEEPRDEPPRRRHWRRWVLGGVVALVVLAVAAAGVAVKLTPGPAPLALPKDAAAPSGPLDGAWQVTAGSVTGFRVRETIIGFSNDVTGRTGDVAGTVVVAGAQVSRATFRVSLGAITVDGKAGQPQLVKSLGVTAHPAATVTLTRPVPLPAAFSTGATVTRTAAATLTLNGTTRPVTVTLSARRDGTAIEAAGSLPVAFSGFRITGPSGLGFLGSLASDGTAEFLLILRPR